ncbi:DUF4268 domain-containing protein [Vibrio splendidus]|uniref:Putative inner membrane protein n=1 Tax=Vibrio sp. FF_286 TaxID=1652831 RepID=A0A0H3ZQT0_9VIBR|nr:MULTISPECIES: DUF4268 domain-containing protein [Vibrio]AKN38733.1 putative inner membrane protein [Vibrio sp. FF_286]PMJ55906.1 hypothetical protein BCU23_03090 [Vibrio splendidus]TCV12427.1 uncharacterized protein DUF4268 [Vibrio crassostreae]TWD64805.1 uncharacterized protein DUF4268 [Vibrio crassostreae]CAK1960350.1 putative inner membrane protein [Vibrio crassostreae]
MFKIDTESNRISRIETKRFSELGFRERDHLQEWLANQPDALGEELLIIQKEFDGFDDTRERLDLLALDKDGNLVIIENKLDDTGRDVMWQALKYASYCSNLTKSQIVEIFQSYLERFCGGGDARSQLCEFLDAPDLSEVVLNSGINQRLMLVAANFRKEVTSTALWLLNHDIQVQCFKVTPYAMAQELFLNVEQIIPTPEAKELMIGMNAKEAEEKSTSIEIKHRHKIRHEFWERLLERMTDSSCRMFDNISPSKDQWLGAGSGVRNCRFNLIFGTKEARVELYLSRQAPEENNFVFDELFKQRADIEEKFGSPIDWQRLDSKKACRIKVSKEFDGYNREHWPEIVEWLIHNMTKFELAFKSALLEVNRQLKSTSFEEQGVI